MTEAVESETFRKSRGLSDLKPRSLKMGSLLSISARENKIGCAVHTLQNFKRLAADRDRLRLRPLRIYQSYKASVKVNVLPPQFEKLAATEAGRECKLDECRRIIERPVVQYLDESGKLFVGHELSNLVVHSWHLNTFNGNLNTEFPVVFGESDPLPCPMKFPQFWVTVGNLRAVFFHDLLGYNEANWIVR